MLNGQKYLLFNESKYTSVVSFEKMQIILTRSFKYYFAFSCQMFMVYIVKVEIVQYDKTKTERCLYNKYYEHRMVAKQCIIKYL